MYHISIQQKKSAKKMSIIIDGQPQEGETIMLINDKIEHDVQIELKWLTKPNQVYI